jgi:hypothetical protein
MLLCAVMLLVPAFTSAQTPQPAAMNALRIVVIAGEDAINIIQQKTAVNPIVEVRDRNNLPVSGVAVTFSVGGQGASFAGGASTLTLTTNAAGQAVVTGLTPTATGAITINASAVVNGQTIAATITQTNFATAAEAASAASSAGGASGAGGGASGGGASGAAGGGTGGIGGMSGATLGIVGGGIAAAGALVATQAGGGSAPAVSTGTSGTAAAPTTPAPTTPAPTTTSQTLNGPVSETVAFTWTSSFGSQVIQTCNSTYTRTGTLRLILTTQAGGAVTGTGQLMSMVTNVTSIRCSDGLSIPIPGNVAEGANGGIVPVTGTTGSLRFQEDVNITDNSQGIAVTIRGSSSFTGSLSGGVVTGTLTDTFALTGDGSGVSVRGNWSSTSQVTAR